MIKLVVALLVSLASVDAFAVWDAVIPSGANTLTYVTGGVQVSNGPGTGSMFIGRTFNTPSSGATAARAALVDETLSLGVGGNTLQVVAERAIGMEAIAGSMSGLSTAALMGVNAGLAIAAAGAIGFQAGAPISKFLGNDSFTIGDTRCTATNSGWQCDQGQPSHPSNGYQCASPDGNIGVGTSPSMACSQALKKYDALGSVSGYTQKTTVDGCDAVSVCTVTRVVNDQNGYSSTVQFPVNYNMVTVQSCPASIDALNPAWSVPDGTSPDADGKCKSGRYNAPTSDYLADRIKAYADPSKAADAAKAWVDAGGPIKGAQPLTIDGPTTVAQAPTTTTTTNPDGSTTTSTKSPTTNYTYGPTTINYNTTTVTTTTNNGNTTTTTETSGAGVMSAECRDNPDMVGCLKLGEPDNSKPEWQSKPVEYHQEDLGLGAGCPPPYSFVVHGWTLTLNYQPACDVAPAVRPGILALAALGAIAFIVATVSKS